jgi:signal peptidase
MKTKKRILDIFIFVLTVFVVVQVFLPNIAIQYIGFRNFVVISNSMEPEINVNDIVIVKKTDPSKLKVGDTITFYTFLPTIHKDENNHTIYERHVVTHRLGEIESNNENYVFKTYGLKNNPDLSFDQWKDKQGQPVDITQDDIIGLVVLTIPKLGAISMLIYQVFYNPILLLLIIFNIVIIVVVIKVIIKSRKVLKS